MTPASNHHAEEKVGLEEKVTFLKQSVAYADAPDTVEAVETHMAWIFLTDRHAYKLKKPIVFEELDFTTVERRHWACAEEVRLNRRLAGDVYQGVVPLGVGPRGELRLGDGGELVDWLVQMQRLPAARMLDALIEADAWSPDGIRAAARKLAHFYRAAEPAPFAPAEYVQHFYDHITDAAHALAASAYPIPRERVRATFETQIDFLRRTPDLLEARARAKRIVEGHGDLRPEHICLIEEPVVFDCLEFDRTLRLLDPADELGFLAMECARLDAPAIGALVLETYADVAGDTPPERLLHFYQSYRALQRAQLAVRHPHRPGTFDEAKWSDQAETYLQLAIHHADRL